MNISSIVITNYSHDVTDYREKGLNKNFITNVANYSDGGLLTGTTVLRYKEKIIPQRNI